MKKIRMNSKRNPKNWNILATVVGSTMGTTNNKANEKLTGWQAGDRLQEFLKWTNCSNIVLVLNCLSVIIKAHCRTKLQWQSLYVTQWNTHRILLIHENNWAYMRATIKDLLENIKNKKLFPFHFIKRHPPFNHKPKKN